MKPLLLTLYFICFFFLKDISALPGCGGGVRFEAQVMINDSPEPILLIETEYPDSITEHHAYCSFGDSVSFRIYRYCLQFSLSCFGANIDSAALLQVVWDSVVSYIYLGCHLGHEFFRANCPDDVGYLSFRYIFGYGHRVYIHRNFSAGIFSEQDRGNVIGIRVLDFSGREILYQDFGHGVYEQEVFSFLHQYLPSGIYILAMKYEEEVVYRKIGVNYTY